LNILKSNETKTNKKQTNVTERETFTFFLFSFDEKNI